MPKLNAFLILSLLFSMASQAQPVASKVNNGGLYFYSYDRPKEQRTSLRIPVEKTLGDREEGFSLTFDFKIRTLNQNYGYVFRMLGKNRVNLDFVIPDLRVNDDISLIFHNKAIIRLKRNRIPNFNFETWNHVNLTISRNKISFALNGVKYAAELKNGFIPVDIFFGSSTNPEFPSYDVPPMTLKNIRLLDADSKIIRHWSLIQHGQNVAYDTYKRQKAIAVNPKWEIDSHYKWEKKKSLKFDMFPQIAFDKVQERLFIAQSSNMLIYNVKTGILDTLNNIPGNPYNCMANQMIYDDRNNQLISYNFLNDTLATYNIQKKRWNYSKKEKVVPHFWHHSRYFDQESQTLITVGGYGYFKYKGIMMQYPLTEKKWKQLDIAKSISPRYLGSLGYLEKNKLLYFGGYGSESGNQEESPTNHYDLFQLDLGSNKITRLWDKKFENTELHYTNGNSMIVDKRKGVFYVLSYPNSLNKSHIQAKEFNIADGAQKNVGNTIPYLFNDNRSYCDLFYGEASNKLLAITAHTSDSELASTIDLYTIEYTPYSASEIFQKEDEPSGSNSAKFIAILCVVLVAGTFLILKNIKKTKPSQEAPLKIYTDAHPNFDLPKNTDFEIMPSSINLIGGFQIIDKEGNDISKEFPPTVKSLFLIILFSSLSNRKRISSSNLKDILWFDKDDNSARNNRNVNMSKLRSLLLRVGNIEVLEEHNFWSLSYPEAVFCDYQAVLAICEKIRTVKEFSKTMVNELISLASRGKLLTDINAEWVDFYKSEYTIKLIETLLKIADSPMLTKDYELHYKIGAVILLQDSIDENGIKLKCYGLYHLNHKGEALKCYHKFCEEYKRLLAEDYQGEFNDLIKNI